MSYLSSDELSALGFHTIGRNVRISDRASIYNPASIELGDNVRIDDFCVLSAGAGGITIGNYVHVAVYTSLIGAGHIALHDFCNLSSRVSVYSSNDDYSGQFMTNPMVPDIYKNVKSEDVVIGRHVIVGCGSVILPGVRLAEGVAVGALSLVNRNCDSFRMYAGVPAKRLGVRSQALLDQEQRFLRDLNQCRTDDESVNVQNY